MSDQRPRDENDYDGDGFDGADVNEHLVEGESPRDGYATFGIQGESFGHANEEMDLDEYVAEHVIGDGSAGPGAETGDAADPTERALTTGIVGDNLVSKKAQRSGDPRAAAREAEEAAALRLRAREIEDEILARTPENNPEPSLERVRRAMELLGDPQTSFPMIHLTGTNGKTSTTRIVERLVREHGLKTGRFTSPHLHDFRERISLDGEPVDVERLVRVWDDIEPFIAMVDHESTSNGGVRMTYFEVVVVLAYAVFADAPVDVAIVEVGLGGAWDATNVADGVVSVVTPVALDHQRLLGDTVEDIAHEKKGIIKPGAFAVVAAQVAEVDEILREQCLEVDATMLREGDAYAVTAREAAVGGQMISVKGLAGEYDDLFLPLFGAHQAHNAATAIAAVEAFLGGGETKIDDGVLRAALDAVTSPGRLEVVRRSPTVLVDAAHNPAGAQALREALADSFQFNRLVGLVAVLADKDAEELLLALEPTLDHVVVTRNTSPRSMDPRELGQLAAELYGDDRVTVVDSLPDALDRAAALADDEGVGGGVLATGSVVTAADVRMLLGVTSS
ncbi:bifunctional folylpolyglutamate synthase/dihydrofolate synthase [Dermacoccus nishinomiyaensis]|uniref:bifunctional folylpolyglutamate synthase/dihydrofolate synthase n=1 Tax=Dermacoccus nishinomiyaensis TaxID=1274 RepID=UPI000E010841|nr:folylpolyglutamate synthase/dihydrofolate synthase family protein [Dermacoccus nishinomiyaensis]QQY25759.1 bifunctional folylpolyglutamate synthase/dihydrofolate synthase [Dermacoccus nishinomiyaensis]STD16442.1 Folylpolyglutamate synthase [Dermacoccus nishinomiyaensis]